MFGMKRMFASLDKCFEGTLIKDVYKNIEKI